MPGFQSATNCRAAALSRRTLDKAQTSARQFDIPLAFDSAEDLCASSEVDAVFVTTPNALHLQDVLIAIKHGKPVLCEKPMAINATQCRQMVEAAAKANVLLGVAQVFRFEETTAWFRDQLTKEEIGRPIFARSEFSFSGGPGHPRAWINDASVSGGGPVADVGVHCIDALRFILQDEVARVTARGFCDDNSGEVEAGATLILEFSRGTLGTVSVSFRAEYRTPFEIVGSNGALRADDAFNVERPIEMKIQHGGKTALAATLSNSLAYTRQVEAFAAAVEGKTRFPVPGEEGWRNQQVLDAAYRSLRSGKTEDVLPISV